MAEIINGLQIDVPADELKKLLLGRFHYHSEKVVNYEKQLLEFEKFEKTLAEEAKAMGKTSNASPKDSLEQALKKHKNQQIYYSFMSEHIVPNAVYRLAEPDLTRLGVQVERYY